MRRESYGKQLRSGLYDVGEPAERNGGFYGPGSWEYGAVYGDGGAHSACGVRCAGVADAGAGDVDEL